MTNLGLSVTFPISSLSGSGEFCPGDIAQATFHCGIYDAQMVPRKAILDLIFLQNEMEECVGSKSRDREVYRGGQCAQ